MIDPAPGQPPPSGPSPASPAASKLERELTGDLPCVVCRYNLKGISIRSACPECGTEVRATILAVVDPLASELRPIRVLGRVGGVWGALLLAVALMLWSGGALGAAVVCWLPHIAAAWDAARVSMGTVGRAPLVIGSQETAALAGALVLMSGLGAIGLVRPHDGLRRRHIIVVALGVLAYLPLAYLVWSIESGTGFGGSGVGGAGGASASYLRAWTPDGERTRLRLEMGGLIVFIALALRPHARLLVARSLALRSGRVDRQTLAALAVAALVAAAGDGLALVSRSMSSGGPGGGGGETARIWAIVLIAMGSSLLTLGLAGAMIDCWRIGRAIRKPAPTLGEMLGEER